MNLSNFSPLTVKVVAIPRCDRWQAQQRLQALCISCRCSTDGRLEVEIEHPVALAQLRSVVQQLTAPRSELVNWLERCWLAS